MLIVGVMGDHRPSLVEFSAAFASGESTGTRVMFILGGLITVAFGVVLCARPGLGAITLALLFGLFNLIIGIWMLVQGIELRRTDKTLQSARPGTPERAAASSRPRTSIMTSPVPASLSRCAGVRSRGRARRGRSLRRSPAGSSPQPSRSRTPASPDEAP